MWGRWVSRIAAWLLRNSRLSVEDRQILTSAVLDKLGALPLRASITVSETGAFFINGKRVDVETARKLHEGSKSMLNNFARRYVRETVTFLAVKKGVHENVSPEQGLFAKAALWFGDEEDTLYRSFAQNELEGE